MRITKKYENPRILCDNKINHEYLWIPYGKNENHETYITICENNEHHENIEIPFENYENH